MASTTLAPADVGQKVEWFNESFGVIVTGIVFKQNEQSVCVTVLDYMTKHRDMYANERTVVSHKRYKILK